LCCKMKEIAREMKKRKKRNSFLELSYKVVIHFQREFSYGIQGFLIFLT
jgi:hypothetical protein